MGEEFNPELFNDLLDGSYTRWFAFAIGLFAREFIEFADTLQQWFHKKMLDDDK